MAQANNVIEVRSGEEPAAVLQRLEQLPQGAQVLLRLPQDGNKITALDVFNSLRDVARRNELELTVESPEKTVIGLARLYGFEVVSLAPRRETRAVNLDVAEDAAGTLPPSWKPLQPTIAEADLTEGSTASPAPAAPPTMPPWTVVPADRPAAAPSNGAAAPPRPVAPAMSETEYLFGGAQGDELEKIVAAADDRTPTPPPNVRLNMPATADSGATDDVVPSYGALNPAADRFGTGVIPAIEPPEPAFYSRTPRPTPPRPAAAGLGGFVGRILPKRKNATTGATATAAPRILTGNGSISSDRSTPLLAADGPLAVETASLAVAGTSTIAAVGAPTASGSAMPYLPSSLKKTRSTVVTQRKTNNLVLPLAIVAVLLLLLLAGAYYAANYIVPTWTTADVKIALKSSQDVGPIVVSVPVHLGASSGGATTMGVSSVAAQETPAPSGGILNTGPETTTAVEAQIIQHQLVVADSRDTTGGRQVPNNAARGTVELTNQSADAFTIPAGTALGTVRGKNFVTAADVTVPGTDFWNHSFGVARVDFVATEPGPDSNGISLTGGYGNAVFYTVQESAGGDTRTIKQVSDADVKALLTDLRGRIAAQAEGAVMGDVQGDMTAVAGTVAIPEDSWKAEFDHAVGEDADKLALKLTAVPQVYAYRRADVEAAINSALTGGIVTQGMPLDASVEQSSVTHGDINVAGQAADGSIVYTTTATAKVAYTVPPAMAATVKQLVVGDKPDDARYDVMSSQYGPYVESIDITMQHPLGWTQANLPTDPDKIKIDLDGASAATEPK